MSNGREEQLRLALGPFQNRRLFSDHFLKERLPEWPEFALSPDTRDLQEALNDLWRAEQRGLRQANEGQTEERWVQPVLRALGFAYTVQAGVRVGTGRRQPDYALFLGDAARAEADGRSGVDRYAPAVAVADAKRFDRPLEGRGRSGALSEDPVAQIIHYVSVTRQRWGVLTNGRLWRLYGAAGDLVEGACYEVDLVALLEADDSAAFRYFALFFGAEAFEPDRDGRSFLDRALDESRANAVEVGAALERSVFTAVPLIAEGLLGDEERSDDSLAAAFDHALVLLYRLLFCLHAEARALLPVDNRHYVRYGLARLAGELAGDIAAGRVFSSRSDDLYNDLRALFRIVDEGDSDLGVPEYDGGLFSAARHPWFAGRSVPDALLAPALDGLFRVGGESVDYRALAVRHLGTIYERLLDFRLVEDVGRLRLAPATGRHAAGAYFTPAAIVDRIVERTLEPLLMRRSAALAETGATSAEALEHFLELRVLDPAMRSETTLFAERLGRDARRSSTRRATRGSRCTRRSAWPGRRALYGSRSSATPTRRSLRAFRAVRVASSIGSSSSPRSS